MFARNSRRGSRSLGPNGSSRLYKKNIRRCGPTNLPNCRKFIGLSRYRSSFFIYYIGLHFRRTSPYHYLYNPCSGRHTRSSCGRQRKNNCFSCRNGTSIGSGSSRSRLSPYCCKNAPNRCACCQSLSNAHGRTYLTGSLTFSQLFKRLQPIYGETRNGRLSGRLTKVVSRFITSLPSIKRF